MQLEIQESVKTKYELPEMDVICLLKDNVIATSGIDGGEVELRMWE